MISMKTALITGLALAPLALGAAHASNPDEYTLSPMGVGSSSSSTVIYSPETYTSSSTIQTQPAAGDDGQFQDVDINDYLIEDSNTNSQ